MKAKYLLPLLALSGLFVQSLGAQTQIQTDTVRVFRFTAGCDGFYLAKQGNGEELKQLCSSLETDIERLRAGQMYISVSSYATSGNGHTSARRMAYLHGYRVKSELITRAGVTEQMFVTDKIIPSAYGADSLRNVVVVTFPANVQKVEQIAGKEAAERVTAYRKEVYGDTPEPVASDVANVPKEPVNPFECDTVCHAERSEVSTPPEVQEEATFRPIRKNETLSLRANLLRWATLTPNLGIEWRINRYVGILVDGSWTSWSWDDKNRRYALWEVSPEVRYYIGKEKRGFLGAMYHVGGFDYKLGDTGRQGDCQGGGITGGYLLKLNRAFSLDFHAGAGFTHAEYDKYGVIDGVRVRQGSEDKNYWGINQLGITLVWKLF